MVVFQFLIKANFNLLKLNSLEQNSWTSQFQFTPTAFSSLFYLQITTYELVSHNRLNMESFIYLNDLITSLDCYTLLALTDSCVQILPTTKWFCSKQLYRIKRQSRNKRLCKSHFGGLRSCIFSPILGPQNHV